MKATGKRITIVSGLLASIVLALATYLGFPHLRFRYRFEYLGLNAQRFLEYRHRQTGIVFVRLPGGTFWMGAQTMTNCTISGNSGTWGAGVYCEDSSPTLTNCTISGNSAPPRCGVQCYSSSPTLTSCIVLGNAGEPMWMDEGSIPVVSYSCIEGDLVWPGEGNINADPLLVQMGQWEECDSAAGVGCVAYQWDPVTGVPTAWHRWIPGDYHLQPGSPAIDAGTSVGAPTTDIEGHGRPCGNGVDIGAYEFGDCAASGTRFVRGDVDGNGNLEITDAIKVLGYLFTGDADPSCLDAADVDDSGSINITDAIYSLAFQFLGGAPPRRPFPDCGIQDKLNELGCVSYPGCQ